METKYSCRAFAQFHEREGAIVEVEQGAPRIIHFEAPPEFGGEPGFWTPENFLLAAVAACFVATFKSVAKASKLEFQGIEVSVEGTVEREAGGFRFAKLVLSPTAIIFAEHDRERTQRLLRKSERICLITRSLSCATELEPKVLVERTVAA